MFHPTGSSTNLFWAAGAPGQAMSTVVLGVLTAVTTLGLLLWLLRIERRSRNRQDGD